MIWLMLILIIVVFALVGIVYSIFWIKNYSTKEVQSTVNQEQPAKIKHMMRNVSETLTVRMVIIAVIALMMLIPLTMVNNVVDERHGFYQSVLNEFSNLWGQLQTLKGPVLVIPLVEERTFEETVTDESGEEKVITQVKHYTRNAIILPENLNMNIDLREDYRERGIYEALVYTSNIKIDGTFTLPKIDKFSDHIQHINWHEAYLSFGLTETKAINNSAIFLWDNQEKIISSGTNLPNLLGNGFHMPLNIEVKETTSSSYTFNLELNINGSKGIRFAPFGESTTVNMNSSWPHPSFMGNTLPDEHKIDENGFSALWLIPHIARNYPQAWILESKTYDLNELLAGVDLFQPIFIYSKITRAVKYGLLFVVLTFLTFLTFELTTRNSLHYVQYGLIGTALALFYLILLSLSEHIGFDTSYILATVMNIGLISSYTGAVLKSKRHSMVIMGLLSALYLILYSLLQMEDYALLMGTGLLLALLMILMYLTRNLKMAPLETADQG